MRKVIFIAMAALTLLTAQCKKNEPKPEEKVMVPITGNVDFGGSKTEITTSGMINPMSGDKIYIYYEGDYAGYMACTPTTGQQFTCSGEIEGDCLGKTCTFMYLGTGSTEADGTTGISKTSSTISFADQRWVNVSDGKISGLEKFHVGSCQAQVSDDGKVTLPMATKMSIAHFQLTDGTKPIANQDVTVSGVSATANINKTYGTLTGVAGDITVRTDAQGKFYMALVPQSSSATFTFTDAGYGSQTFPNGIRECSFYSNEGSGQPIVVSLYVPEFSVSGSKKVTFSKGNLYNYYPYVYPFVYSFEKEQWFYRTQAGYISQDPDSYNNNCYYMENGTAYTQTQDGYVGIYAFERNPNGSDCGSMCADGSPIKYFDNYTRTTAWHLFTNNQTEGVEHLAEPNPDFHVNGETGENKWRTLSKSEWEYLLARTKQSDGTTKMYGLATVNSIKGLILLPDGWTGSLAPSFTYGHSGATFGSNVFGESTTPTWAQMETAGAVFLPAAGRMNYSFPFPSSSRLGLYSMRPGLMQQEGCYMTATVSSDNIISCLRFYNGTVEIADGSYRVCGSPIRLVRDVE